MKGECSNKYLQYLKFLVKGSERLASNISNVNSLGTYDIKIFSDNILIAQKVADGKLSNQIISMVNLAGSIQLNALVQFGFLSRGGMSIGELSIDSTVVWGKGLIDAYKIENSLANYPRIILSNQLINAYDSCTQKELNLYAFIKEDFDCLWFVDFLMAAPNITLIPQISERLRAIVDPYHKESDKLKQKINWLIAHFNVYCRKYKDRGYEEYAIPYVK